MTPPTSGRGSGEEAENAAPEDAPVAAALLRLPAAGWLLRALGRLLDWSPELAGEVVLGLLPSQHLQTREWLDYDLVLGGDGLVRVSARGEYTVVERFPAGSVAADETPLPRHPSEVDFQVVGDLPGLARLLAGGTLLRRLNRGVARVRGRRARFELLQGVLTRPASLEAMVAAGARPTGMPALALVGALLSPAQTAGRLVTLAHVRPGVGEPHAFLHINSRQAPQVSTTPGSGPVDAAVVCLDNALLPALLGEGPAEVRGDASVLEWLRGLLQEAQRD